MRNNKIQTDPVNTRPNEYGYYLDGTQNSFLTKNYQENFIGNNFPNTTIPELGMKQQQSSKMNKMKDRIFGKRIFFIGVLNLFFIFIFFFVNYYDTNRS